MTNVHAAERIVWLEQITRHLGLLSDLYLNLMWAGWPGLGLLLTAIHGRWWQSMCGPHHRCVQLAWQLALDCREIRPSTVYVTARVYLGVCFCVCIVVTSKYKPPRRPPQDPLTKLHGAAVLDDVAQHTVWIQTGYCCEGWRICVSFIQPPVMGNGLGREERVMYWKISLSAPQHYLS